MNVLTKNDRKRLDEYNSYKFAELHTIVLEDDGVPNIKDKILEI
jgi:hypothetical protein